MEPRLRHASPASENCQSETCPILPSAEANTSVELYFRSVNLQTSDNNMC